MFFSSLLINSFFSPALSGCFSKQKHPRILIVVPTRELVVQVVAEIESLTPYINVRFAGVYGGTNLNKQKQLVFEGQDILVATPGRLLDLALDGILKLKYIQKLVIDEVDEMMNLGFRPQLITLLDLLPKNRQSIMFSATLTNEVASILDQFFKSPIKIEIAASGSPLDTIKQLAYPIPNFYTKVNFLVQLLKDKETFKKVLVFVKNKKQANILYEELEGLIPGDTNVIHSNKTQNYRLRAVNNFEKGFFNVLIASDIIARGLDFTDVSHVINFNIPEEHVWWYLETRKFGTCPHAGFGLGFERLVMFVTGMTNMIMSRIKNLEVTKRPMHCTDLKRETLYIKDKAKLHLMIFIADFEAFIK